MLALLTDTENVKLSTEFGAYGEEGVDAIALFDDDPQRA